MFAVFLLCSVSLLLTGCIKEAPEEPQKKVVTGHGGTPVTVTPQKNAEQATIVALKNNKLVDYSQKTIGEAFGSYQFFEKKEWRETRLKGGKIYIDFIGLNPVGAIFTKNDENLAATGVAVKFVIYLKGDFNVAMISKLEVMKDGKINAFPVEDKKQLLDAIYANKEITF